MHADAAATCDGMPSPLPALTPVELAQRIKNGDALRLLDVREPHEFVSEIGHVEGAELVPLGTLPQALARFQGEEREVICICRSGMRSQQAAGFLASQGLRTRNLTGGMLAWNDAKLPISR